MRTFKTVIVTLLTVLLLAGLATPASADGGIPPIGGGTGTTPDPGTGQPPPGGGGGAPIPPPCEGCTWASGSIYLIQASNWTTDHMIFGSTWIHFSCPPRTVGGQADWFATGAWWQAAVSPDGDIVPGTITTGCTFPPQPVDTPVWCSAKVSGTITNTEGPSSVRLMVSKSRTSAWARNRFAEGSAATCATSEDALRVDTVMNDLGLYKVSLLSRRLPCVSRAYPGTSRAARIVRCGSAQDSHKTILGSVFCQPPSGWGWTIGAGATNTRPYWTWDACAQENAGPIRCRTAGDVVRYAGGVATNSDHPVQTFNDGEERAYRFPAFKPSGFASINSVRSNLRFKEGSPFRRGASVSAANQAFTSQYRLNTWHDGDIRSWAVGFQNPGVRDFPFTVARNTTATGTARVKTVKVTSIDFATGAIQTDVVWRIVPATVTCDSPEAYVDVFRARNAS